MWILLPRRHLMLLLSRAVLVVIVVVVVMVVLVIVQVALIKVVKCWPELVNNKLEARDSKYRFGTRTAKHKFGPRAGKHKFEGRASKYKSGARASKYKLGARTGKCKLGARAGGQSQGLGPSKGPGAGKYKYPNWSHFSEWFFFFRLQNRCDFYPIQKLFADHMHFLLQLLILTKQKQKHK